jgi:P-type E1-E2 ATPase
MWNSVIPYSLSNKSRIGLAVFAVADVVRPESHEAVRLLHQRGVEVVMMTGDARAVANSVAAVPR